MSRTAPVSHVVSLILYGAILALLVVTTFWPDPVEGASVWLMLTIKLVPLLILLPGLLKSRGKTYQWLCFILMIYFTDAVVRAYLTGWAWPPTVMTGLTAGLFVSAIVRIRAMQ
ncbi:DUF2069 domain-containing protein [Hydrocarboniclastica marina]|uniref:DUF2069 domain-containing protein n=1 Tax=Hydrocarboniclastica marina TaxID=2259620 RepID=A0A4P7XKD1_9ALTE|nr:DUF2069 domain-containing protein [Hydrocarboniclastica marina]MAL98890.1 hypothetical protein [Alteromonadaceae bacterium]QCF26387.1 DUF2069 domain-containing protein [Hydrocarboniclastica marina]|tara:strand:- start:413 stop:754 length:342 start_codon:yes stop_codon:yes gene_type:complete